MKLLKDYLPFYIGCELFTGTGTVTLVGVHIDKFNWVSKAVVLNGNITHTSEIEDVKPILRPLLDMKENEFATWKSLEDNNINRFINGATSVDYLLKQGFDLFNLIPDGLAIDKTTL